MTANRFPAGPVPVSIAEGTIEVADLTVESNALTNPQLRAAPVAVDTEMPAAAVPSGADDNTAAPAVVARLQALHKATNKWRSPSTANADGSAVTPADTLAVTQHVYSPATAQAVPVVAAALTDADGGNAVASVGARGMLWDPTGAAYSRARGSALDGGGQAPRGLAATTPHNYDATATAGIPQRTAKSLGDTESGAAFAGAGQMVYNGTTYERVRSHLGPVALLASATRTTQVQLPDVVIPAGLTHGVLVINVTASDATNWLELRIVAATGIGTILAGLRIPAAAPAGVYGIALGCGASLGTSVNPPNSGILIAPGNYVAAHSPAPVPRSLGASYVLPQTAGASWTYAVSGLFTA